MNRFKHDPLPRHEALIPLSRDHYVGLVQARRLRNAADADDAERRKVLAAFADAWRHEIAVHFQDEERLLLPLLNPEDAQRLQAEHATLRTLVEQALAQRRRVDPDPKLLRQLAEQINAHIRWEERELFNRVQEGLGEQKLAALRAQTFSIEQARPRHTGPSAVR